MIAAAIAIGILTVLAVAMGLGRSAGQMDDLRERIILDLMRKDRE